MLGYTVCVDVIGIVVCTCCSLEAVLAFSVLSILTDSTY
jgi:hypothetical protein